MAIFYLLYSASPKPSHPEVEEIGGVFVNFWISAKTLAEAKATSLAALDANDWTPDEPEEAREVSEAYYADNPEGLSAYRQALRDGIVMIEYVFPPEEEGEPEN